MAQSELASSCSISGPCPRHVKGSQVVFWELCDQVWLMLTLLVVAASVEHVEGMSKALRWCSEYFVIKYGSV